MKRCRNPTPARDGAQLVVLLIYFMLPGGDNPTALDLAGTVCKY
jgi:hypothetical protein